MSFGIPVRNGLAIGLLSSTTLSSNGGLFPAMYLDFLQPFLDNRVTFTRASTATFVGSNGLIQSAAINAPRFDYDPVTLAPKGLLIEEQRTNLIFPADGTTGWGASPASSVTATANSLTSPDGTTNATKVATNDTLSNGHTWFKTFAGAISTAYVGSVYLKAGEYTRSQVTFGNTAFAATTGALFDLSNGTVVVTAGGSTATITAVGNGWYRCTVTATSDADGGAYVFGASPKPASVTTIDAVFTSASVGLGGYVYGIQVEAGAFATSYIPTVASQVTRSADVATMTGTNFSSWYNLSEGTFTVGFTSNGFASNAMVFSATDGTLTNLIQSYWSNATTITMDGGALATMSLTAAQNTRSTLAYAYKLNDYAAAINGGSVTTDTSGTPPPSMSQLNIGNRNGALFMNGHIRSIAYYNSRLSDAQLQALTEPSLITALSLDFINGLYDA